MNEAVSIYPESDHLPNLSYIRSPLSTLRISTLPIYSQFLIMETERILYKHKSCHLPAQNSPKTSHLMKKFKILLMAHKGLYNLTFFTLDILLPVNLLLAHSFPATLASVLLLRHTKRALTWRAWAYSEALPATHSHGTPPSFIQALPCSQRLSGQPFIKQPLHPSLWPQAASLFFTAFSTTWNITYLFLSIPFVDLSSC